MCYMGRGAGHLGPLPGVQLAEHSASLDYYLILEVDSSFHRI